MDDYKSIYKIVFTAFIVILLGSSGLWYLINLFQPLANQLRYRTEQADPAVVQSRQEEVIKILNDIESSRNRGDTAQVLRGRTLLRQVMSHSPYLDTEVRLEVDRELTK